jgi:glucokinase
MPYLQPFLLRGPARGPEIKLYLMKDLNTSLDPRIVMTLDAGGTNFVFTAIRGNRQIVDPISRPSNSSDLDRCLETLLQGFGEVKKLIPESPSAISFAFPGPADYQKGIFGDLPNFEAFRGGVAMGPMLEDHFKLPVFIENDGNLYAYGEALSGYLPALNRRLQEAGSIKTFRNLIGITLGTGFGCGIVIDGELLAGDNSCGAEIHNTTNRSRPDWNAEESVSTRAIQRVYAEAAGKPFDFALMPRDIFHIALGDKKGSTEAALEAFSQYGENLGSSIANVLTLVDGIVVLGGGITAAWDLFAPAMFTELGRNFENFRGIPSQRLSYRCYNLEDETAFPGFAAGGIKKITVPGSGRIVEYDDLPRTGIGRSRLGASLATSLGAYAFALRKLNKGEK